MDGITEVRLAVAASTIMLVLALLPLVFCGGITQLMFVGLVYPIIFGLIASFLVSLTLTALLASRLLRAPQHGGDGAERAWQAMPLQALQDHLDRLDLRYQRLVRLLLKNKFSVVAAAVCTVIVGFGFYHVIGSEMMPLADVGQAYGVLEMEPGASYAQTEAAAAALERDPAAPPRNPKSLHRDRRGAGRDVLHGLRHEPGQLGDADDHPLGQRRAPEHGLAGH